MTNAKDDVTRAAGVPVAVPVAWSTTGRTPTSGAREVRSRETTLTSSRGRQGSPERSPARPVGSVRLERIRQSLSERDWGVVCLVADHRYLSTRQIEGFFFHDHASALTAARVCRRVLRRLAEQRVLQPLERRIGGIRAGSASYVWQVGPIGQRLLGGHRRRAHEPSQLFLGHSLAVADAHLGLVQADRATALALERVDLEPDCWRAYTGLGGSREVLKPDLYVLTLDPADPDYELRWFIEIDLGTENLARLMGKCRRYQEAARSEGEGFPLVVWAMTNEPAAERLREAVGRDDSLDARLFVTTTQASLTQVIGEGGSHD